MWKKSHPQILHHDWVVWASGADQMGGTHCSQEICKTLQKQQPCFRYNAWPFSLHLFWFLPNPMGFLCQSSFPQNAQNDQNVLHPTPDLRPQFTVVTTSNLPPKPILAVHAGSVRRQMKLEVASGVFKGKKVLNFYKQKGLQLHIYPSWIITQPSTPPSGILNFVGEETSYYWGVLLQTQVFCWGGQRWRRCSRQVNHPFILPDPGSQTSVEAHVFSVHPMGVLVLKGFDRSSVPWWLHGEGYAYIYIYI